MLSRFMLMLTLILAGEVVYMLPFGLVMLFGYWGVTTILLFWAAMIRATREWGGDDAQGRAFGILEGGRGVVAVLFATAGVALFAIFMPDDVQSVSDAGRRAALRDVILLYSGVTLAAGILTWLVIPHRKHIGDSSRSIFKPAFAVLNRPLVWAQAAVIICAYCGYKGLDNYSLYAVQVLGDVPPFLTGAVAGTVSFIGYTPEIFFGPITGRILDANPGALGFQHYFLFLAFVSAIGVAVVGALARLQRVGSAANWPNEDVLMRLSSTK